MRRRKSKGIRRKKTRILEPWDPLLNKLSIRKAKVLSKDVAHILSVSPKTLSNAWAHGIAEPMQAIIVTIFRRFDQYAASDAGCAILHDVIARVLAAPERRQPSLLLETMFGRRPPPVDYSWPRFIASYRLKMQAGVSYKPFSSRDEFTDFAAAYTNPRTIAANLDLPDPKLPDWETVGETTCPSNNDPPAPPAVTGSMRAPIKWT